MVGVSAKRALKAQRDARLERRQARRKPGRPRRVTRTRGERIIDWIEDNCFVPEGKHVGEKIVLDDFQKDEIKRIYDNPAVTRRAILSFARKNGKTALAACLVLVHLCGPEAAAHPNSQIFSAAQSRDQAALLFNLAAKMVRINPDMAEAVAIFEGTKSLHCVELDIRYRALSAEATTAYGLSPAMIVHDELGQVKGPRSQLYDALETAVGAQAEPLSIIISTQAPTDGDLLSILIDDALAGHDPRTVCRLYTAPPEMDPFAIETIRLANPALGGFLSEREVLAMAADARRMPAREAEYRNLILNQRVEVNNPFVSPAIWKAGGGAVADISGGVECFGGLDLSEVADLTSLVLTARVNDLWHVHPYFWLPSDGLSQKSVADRVPYDQWAREGLLLTCPGSSVSYEYVANFIMGLFLSHNIRRLGFDRWNMRHLEPWLLKAGMSEAMMKERLVPFGQGWASMSPALRDLEQLLLEKRIRHAMHPVLSMCVSNTIIVRDDAGNRKPSKRKSTGRIDGLVAMAMAVGVAVVRRPSVDVAAMIG